MFSHDGQGFSLHLPDVTENALPGAGRHAIHSDDTRQRSVVQARCATCTHPPLSAHRLEDKEGWPNARSDLNVLAGQITHQEAKGLELSVDGPC